MIRIIIWLICNLLFYFKILIMLNRNRFIQRKNLRFGIYVREREKKRERRVGKIRQIVKRVGNNEDFFI